MTGQTYRGVDLPAAGTKGEYPEIEAWTLPDPLGGVRTGEILVHGWLWPVERLHLELGRHDSFVSLWVPQECVRWNEGERPDIRTFGEITYGDTGAHEPEILVFQDPMPGSQIVRECVVDGAIWPVIRVELALTARDDALAMIKVRASRVRVWEWEQPDVPPAGEAGG